VTDQSPDIAMPWYRSRILQGILTVAVTQLVKHVAAHYDIDMTVWGTAVPDIVNGAMDGMSAIALAWAAHARISPTVPIPPVITGTKGAADKINAQTPPLPDACNSTDAKP
jgi:hypothetical protein